MPPDDHHDLGVRAFLIADIRGYTRFTQERGDEAAAALADKFASASDEEVRARGGRLLELRGDEALVVFDSPRDAVRSAIALQDRYLAETVAGPTFPLAVGIGLDAGEAVPVSGGYRGAALNVAARLCARARAGEVLGTSEMVHLARHVDGIRYEDLGSLAFKGIVDPVRVVRIRSEAVDHVEELGKLLPKQPHVSESGRKSKRWLLAGIAVAALASLIIALAMRTSPPSHTEDTLPPFNSVIRFNPADGDVSVQGAGDISLFFGDADLVIGEGSLWLVSPPNLFQLYQDTGAFRSSFPGIGAVGIGRGVIWVSQSEASGSSGFLHALAPGTGSTLTRTSGHIRLLSAEPGAVWAVLRHAVTRIDPDTGQPKGRRFPIGSATDGTALGDTYWVADYTTSTLTKIDLRSGRETTLRLATTPDQILAIGDDIWTLDRAGDTVTVVDATTTTQLDVIPVSRNPSDMEYGDGAIWVSDGRDGTLTRIDAGTRQVSRINVGVQLAAIAFDPDADEMWAIVGSSPANN